MGHSGGQTPVRATDWVIMNLAKLIGVGAGRNAGLLPAHGKAVSPLCPLAPRKLTEGSLVSSTRIGTHQHLKDLFQSNLLWIMQKVLQKLGDCLSLRQ